MLFLYLTSEMKNFIMSAVHMQPTTPDSNAMRACPHIQSVYYMSSSYSEEYAVVLKVLSHTQYFRIRQRSCTVLYANVGQAHLPS